MAFYGQAPRLSRYAYAGSISRTGDLPFPTRSHLLLPKRQISSLEGRHHCADEIDVCSSSFITIACYRTRAFISQICSYLCRVVDLRRCSETPREWLLSAGSSALLSAYAPYRHSRVHEQNGTQRHACYAVMH